MFRTTVRRKDLTMIALLSLAALYAGWRVGRAAYDAVRRVPRHNDDLIFF
jgi:hypothetical protein